MFFFLAEHRAGHRNEIARNKKTNQPAAKLTNQLEEPNMLKSITTKYCAGAIAAAAILICAPKAEATITGSLQVNGGAVNSLGTTIGVNPESMNFTFLGPTGIAGTNVQLSGQAISQIIGTTGQFFDSTVSILNNTGAQATLVFRFEETSTTLPNLAPGIVSAISSASGSNPNVPAVSLTAFKSTLAGTTLINIGAGFDPGGQAGPLSITGANSISKNVLVPVGPFSMIQEFTYVVAAGASINFSNSASVPSPVAVTVIPEPGSFLAGASLLGLIGGSQLLRRKRNREVAC